VPTQTTWEVSDTNLREENEERGRFVCSDVGTAPPRKKEIPYFHKRKSFPDGRTVLIYKMSFSKDSSPHRK